MYEFYLALEPALRAFIAPLLYPFDPSRRVFWGFTLSSLLLAFWFYYHQSRSTSLVDFLRYVFRKRIWLHPSSLLDVKLLFTNSLISKSLIAPLIVSKLTIIVFVSSGLRVLLPENISPDNLSPDNFSVTLKYWQILLLFTATIFLVEDFTRFALHRAYHKIPWLWEFHKVHHSADVLTPITLYRTHPVEMLISRSTSVIVLGTVTGVFVFLFPGKLSALEILGVDLFGFIFNALGANLRHSHIPLSFGRASRFFVSPVMHQVHHSSLSKHFDKNFGSCFAIWDRIFGSLHIPQDGEKFIYGCRQSGKQTLASQYFGPFNRIYVQQKGKSIPATPLVKSTINRRRYLELFRR